MGVLGSWLIPEEAAEVIVLDCSMLGSWLIPEEVAEEQVKTVTRQLLTACPRYIDANARGSPFS